MNTKNTILSVERVGSAEVGNCITKITYKVKSLNRPLTVDNLTELRSMGMLGVGQEWKLLTNSSWLANCSWLTDRDWEPTEDGCNRHYVAYVVDIIDSSD